MKFCPIALEAIGDGEAFSRPGVRSFHPKLEGLLPLELTHEEQLRQARLRADKMSIQGAQPKLSAVLRVKESAFEIVDRGGRFVLKPNPPPFEEVPANEALTMTMATRAGIEVPDHGLVPAVDGSWIYVIRRFDREGRAKRQHVEDFAQLSGATRDTKYDSSLERVARLVDEFCTFPALERPKLARRLLFCFLTGNEDMHLKNFSLLVRDGIAALSPAYDLLNTTLVLENAREESALPLGGRKRKLSRKLWIDEFCRGRLQLSQDQVDSILVGLGASVRVWRELIRRSYLSLEKKDSYDRLLLARCERLELQ